MRRLAILICSGALVSGSLLAADSDNKDVIDYRQDVMKTMEEQSSILGEMASGVIPSDNMNTDMQILALSASTALKAFTPKVPGGKSKPEIWTNWDDFSKKMNDFAQKASDGAKAAQSQGSDAAMTALVDIANGCKGCHDQYREETKDQKSQ
jgi:cytochrome c556